jgi:hypothetical protein
MSQFSAFFAENAVADVTVDVIVSTRFKDADGNLIPWKIKGLSEGENKIIRKSATKMINGKGGIKIPDIDAEDYATKLALESVVYPNLKDAELQKSYGVVGADNLLNKMLLVGEFATLVEKVQEINGFNQDINKVMEETKN